MGSVPNFVCAHPTNWFVSGHGFSHAEKDHISVGLQPARNLLFRSNRKALEEKADPSVALGRVAPSRCFVMTIPR